MQSRKTVQEQRGRETKLGGFRELGMPQSNHSRASEAGGGGGLGLGGEVVGAVT